MPPSESAHESSNSLNQTSLPCAWETEVDPPAGIAVIGGGATGIEAALYARFLGYEVSVFERFRVGNSLQRWGDLPLHATWRQVASTLGLAALEAQGTLTITDLDQVPSCAEFLEQYLLPVAKTDLLYHNIHIQSEVQSLSRLGLFADASVPAADKAELEFRLLIQSKQRGPYSQIVDLVLDCSGLAGRRGMAPGGGYAAGEMQMLQRNPQEAESRWSSGKLKSKELNALEGQHAVLYGSGLEACQIAWNWRQVHGTSADSKLTWLFPRRRGIPAAQTLPWQLLRELGLPADFDLEAPSTPISDSLAQQFGTWDSQLRQLREGQDRSLVMMEVWGLESIRSLETGSWQIEVQSQLAETLALECDHIINTAPRCSDWSFASPIAVNAASVEGFTSEPHYYVLGSKTQSLFPSAPASIGEQIQNGREQIRLALAAIGGRSELNLYDTVRPQSY